MRIARYIAMQEAARAARNVCYGNNAEAIAFLERQVAKQEEDSKDTAVLRDAIDFLIRNMTWNGEIEYALLGKVVPK